MSTLTLRPTFDCEWSLGQQIWETYFGFRIFNPFAKSNRKTPVAETCHRHEKEKCHKYECLIDIEHSSFTPLIFSATGGMSKLTSSFYMHLAEKLSKKIQSLYSVMIGLIRCRLSFALLRAAYNMYQRNSLFSNQVDFQLCIWAWSGWMPCNTLTLSVLLNVLLKNY